MMSDFNAYVVAVELALILLVALACAAFLIRYHRKTRAGLGSSPGRQTRRRPARQAATRNTPGQAAELD
jgi:hypothetical protein